MSWFRSLAHPLLIYLPILASIIFAPWRFMRVVREGSETEREDLRGFTFFALALSLLIESYQLPHAATGESGLEGMPFASEILGLILVGAFALAYLLTERKSGVNLDTFLYTVLPILTCALLVSIILDEAWIRLLSAHGLPRATILTACAGSPDASCVQGLLPGPPNLATRFFWVVRGAHGHFAAVLLLSYILGLDPLRKRPHLVVESRYARWAFCGVVYLMGQVVVVLMNPAP